MVGAVSYFLGNLPSGWLALDGSTYDQADYPELTTKLDSQYRNDGNGTFTLPDMGGLFVTGAGSSYSLGDLGGASDVTLTVGELPIHSHTYTPPVANVDLEAPGVPDVLAAGVGVPTQTGSTGDGDAHENLPPFVALNYGIFCGRG